ncbi:TPA: UDP-3-O-acyl N-acetylglycosamine deacetylase [Burkholderia multivorans]|uniref:UDP-3-O-acyl N-acetylglycosamine deacetylase n=1 Tax=Burkholderia multivorans TaxID=87883 RepID=UPI001BA25635|nr:UDP-3-O-acyl N-acetylglycosamine deacetylase [Burkholderia multivorans]MBR7899233.1 UDP-3-O-acyl N-acetylglycosamine deacetylase [Burkholderia multivorans]MBU9221306.1 UDP-3-O-acyl N-acetylglycosamine deacetylase [Burkholderia multivorans]MCA8412098.1 UDP-3-O-acyl N-acetylglycosamine deacetylase [Burkholderia multivorans]MDN8011712.1 UDP-3-O-acyl N-acetylglycosamine deacetylase [Burkholderia multivorans]HEM8494221.1 UDP-3-O-acyl N-acetylglycosamine deacetylase [Burkholderia multivorans]
MKAPQGWQTSEGTVARPVAMTGHGLHTGRRVQVWILPVEPSDGHHGIVFRRLHGGRELGVLTAGPALRRAQPLCTMLRSEDGLGVRTVEHLLASLLACEIDHAIVELDAEEVPILDGSARPWIDAITAGGRTALSRAKRFLRVLKPVSVADGAGATRRELRIEPADRYEFSVRDDLKGFGDMQWDGLLTPRTFVSEIASSRSYGRIKWAVPAIAVGYLTGTPILRGARPSCTASIIGNHVIGGLRAPDEFVRHRVLDLVGDLALAGAPLLGRVTAHRPTHEMNYRLLSALIGTPGACEWVDVSA